jgi:hypothetical protein
MRNHPMHIDEWIKERERRERIYREVCREAIREDESLFARVRRTDRAYLAWCETDGWPVEYDEEVKL